MPKSIPNGDVDPTIPGNGAPVCAAIGSILDAAIASITARARKGFIWIDIRLKPEAAVSGLPPKALRLMPPPTRLAPQITS